MANPKKAHLRGHRVVLLDGEMALGIYHDPAEEIDQDAIKLDFLETAAEEDGRVLRSDQLRIGVSLAEAKLLLEQLTAATQEYESARDSPDG
jgi:hypothetical protein